MTPELATLDRLEKFKSKVPSLISEAISTPEKKVDAYIDYLYKEARKRFDDYYYTRLRSYNTSK